MSTFSDRRQALFDCLNVAESQVLNKPRDLFKIPEPRSHVRPDSINSRKMRHETKQFRGRKSLFTRPDIPITQCLATRAQSFQRNLDKWTYYNLEDVQEVTEKTNAEAAAACQREIEISKIPLDVMDDQTEDVPAKIAFKLPIRESSEINDVQIDSNEKSLYVNSKIILPEYVVGQKKCNKLPKQISKSTDSKKSELKLDHLFEEDDD